METCEEEEATSSNNSTPKKAAATSTQAKKNTSTPPAPKPDSPACVKRAKTARDNNRDLGLCRYHSHALIFYLFVDAFYAELMYDWTSQDSVGW